MKSRHLLIAALGMAACFSFSAQAQTVIFGDDTSDWANDGECDDPRFVGNGMTATPLLDEDTFHDASDCRAAHNKGHITLKGSSYSGSGVDFGNNSSQWANDGECDDPRFVGNGMTSTALLEADSYADANDCRAAFDSGSIRLRNSNGNDISFGDNSSSWANDDECDDPRFYGAGSAETLLEEDRGHDANDCRAAFNARTIFVK